MKVVIQTHLGEAIVEGTLQEIKELLSPKYNGEQKIGQVKKQVPPIAPEFVKYFEVKGKSRDTSREKRTYNYYKRESDSAYVVDIVDKKGEIIRVRFGSPKEPESKFSQILTILRTFQVGSTITKMELFSKANGWWKEYARKKCIIDILNKEGFIEQVEDPSAKNVVKYKIIKTSL